MYYDKIGNELDILIIALNHCGILFGEQGKGQKGWTWKIKLNKLN